MTMLRLLSVGALALGVAGCATDSAPKKMSPIKTSKSSSSPGVSTRNLPDTVETVPTRVAAAPVAPQAIDMGPLDGPQPTVQAYVPEQAYESVALSDPQPVYVATSPGYASARGVMAPIYDDPVVSASRSAAPSGGYDISARKAAYRPSEALSAGGASPTVRNAYTPTFGSRLAQAAKSRINPGIRYEPKYVKIGYPWGDVPSNTGVCSDVVVRTYRALGVDLQSLLHDDMRRAFSAYPSKRIYGLNKADPNIDHRRVVNLEAFFERVGASVPVTSNPEDYHPGDIVTWRLSGNEPHTGVVIADRDPRSGNPLIVHNLGAGVKAEDILFLSPPIGHYRFAPDQQTRMASLALKR